MNPDDENYKKLVKEKIEVLRKVFSEVAIGNFNIDPPPADRDDEFAELFAGIKLILETVREKIAQYEDIKNNLEQIVRDKTAMLDEAQKIAKLGSWELDVQDRKF